MEAPKISPKEQTEALEQSRIESAEQKDLEKFVRGSVRKMVPLKREELMQFLSTKSLVQLKAGWSAFCREVCLREANLMQEWRTGDQLHCFQDALRYMLFLPKRGEAGRAVYDRAALEEHILSRLEKYVGAKQAEKAAWRGRPLFSKLHAWSGMATIAVIMLALPWFVVVLVVRSMCDPRSFIALSVETISIVGAVVVGAGCALYCFLMPGVAALWQVVRRLRR